MASGSPLLVGIHLSDNGISADELLMGDILDIFGLNEQDIPITR